MVSIIDVAANVPLELSPMELMPCKSEY